MTKRDRKALGSYCRTIADAVELRDWTVMVAVAVPQHAERKDGREWSAASRSLPGRKYVTVTFDPGCRDWSPEDLRATVCHELLHAHLAPLMDLIREDLGGHLSCATHDLLIDGTTRHMEFAVDALADAVAKHLPLIKWPERK